MSPWLLVALVVGGQAGASPRFDVVSLKPCQTEALPPVGTGGRAAGPGNAQVSPGRAHWDCATVEQLITTAYAFDMQTPLLHVIGSPRPGDPKVVRGGPSWMSTEKFTVEATADATADRATLLGPMLRAFLEDRFKLRTHRDHEERAMYALVVAPGGLKVTPMPADSCRVFDRNAPSADQSNGLPPCGNLNMGGEGGNRKLTLTGFTLHDVAERILSSNVMDRFVIDRTGVDGLFTLSFEFAPDDATPGSAANLAWYRRPGAPDPTAPSIFQAFETQLGLKIEATRALAEFLVVDHIERPAPDGPSAHRPFVSGAPR